MDRSSDNLLLQKIEDDKSLSQILIHLNEMDRKRIARELHDSTIQNLVCLIHKIELASKYIDLDPIRCKLELESIKQYIHENIDEIRGMVYDLRPMSFDDLGFDVLLQQYFDELDQLYDNEIVYSILVDFSNIGKDYLITIYRMIQECCINSIKHSGGGKLSVKIAQKKDNLSILIEDDGKGFDLTSEVGHHHYGIKILKDRIALLDGKLEIYTEVGKGYRTDILIPLQNICIK
ncbi:MAG: sensor histidine kinase [Lachnospiraceae bacterium]|nr:sensor histidine kinase [Lachnospiraceae bacterium]